MRWVTGGGSPMSGDDMRMQRLREYTKKKDSVGYFRELLRTEEQTTTEGEPCLLA